MGAWFFDLLENVGIVSMVGMYPSKPAILAWITMLFGSLKWAFAFVSALDLYCRPGQSRDEWI